MLSRIAISLLVCATQVGCDGHRGVTTTRRVTAAPRVDLPALVVRDSLVSVRIDTTSGFLIMEAVLARPDSGLHQRYRPQLDSARAAFTRGEATWQLTDEYVFGDLIERAQFSGVDLRHQLPIPWVDVETYEQQGPGMWGYRAKRYRLPNGTPFLRLMDWIK